MKELLKIIFSVHKCVSCRKILGREDFDSAFCADCREVYLASKMSICPECSLEAEKCRCMPPMLKKNKVKALRKLFFYSKEKGGEPQNRLVYFIKKNKSRRVTRDVAKELKPLIAGELAREELKGKPVLISVPRSRRALFEYGFDQSALLARELSELCDIEYLPLLKSRGIRAQKKLTAGERMKNVRGRLIVNQGEAERIKGRGVILIDDVVTTGASMSACARALLELGALEILGIAISSDIKP